MIKELVQFTEIALADETFRNLGVAPKEGLHIVLSAERTETQTTIAEKAEFTYYSSKKTKELTPLQEKCAAWSQVAWMVDTNKCFDLPTKAIHSASPFCFALKRENLEGGEKYAENQKDGKTQVYDRINGYFSKASALLDSDEEKIVADAFRIALNDKTRLHRWLEESGSFLGLKDAEYVIFYLDMTLDVYSRANRKYLKEKLFNTSEYNMPDDTDPELIYGTSNWFNGFPTKKLFLQHQTATFNIAGRISSKEAQLLYEFSELGRRKLFPNPLPLFIMKEELYDKALKLYKEDATSGGDSKKGYLELIGELSADFKEDIGNYYLLFMVKGEIRDFDYVSKFEYYLNADRSPWKVEDLFNMGPSEIYTVSDLQTKILPDMFNNALVVRRKDKGWIFHWFDEMEPQYCKTANAYLMAVKYRKAFYDYIYKSKRQGITGKAIEEILMTGIFDDIRLDKFNNKQHSEYFNIHTKLNLLFNLHSYFSVKPNPIFMAKNIIYLREHLDAVARNEAHLENDEQFAFAAGQVIARIQAASMTGDNSYKYLEPFLAQSDANQFKISIANWFKRYKHAVYSTRFRVVSAEVLAYPKEGNIRKLLPVLLAGVFSNNQLFAEKQEEGNSNS